MADMQRVMSELSCRHRVVLTVRNPGKEQAMKKGKKEAKKVVGVRKQGGKVAVAKPEAVDAAMQAVDATKKERPKKEGGKMSSLDAAVQVLAEAKKPMTTKEMVETMLAKGLWKTGGKTPAATIYSAIIREIATKGKDTRFRKADRGTFELATGKEA